MEKHEQVKALKTVLVAIEYAHQLTEAIELLVGGYGIELPDAREQSSAIFWAMQNEKDRLLLALDLAPTHDQYGRLLLWAGQRFVYRRPGGMYPARTFELLSVDTIDGEMRWGDHEQAEKIDLPWIWAGLRQGSIELLGDMLPNEDI